jgi:dolichol-phosphate mannosyltransferase
MKKSLSVILSVFDEEEIIGKSLQELVYFMETNFEKNLWEIIIVDDGSNDNTVEIISKVIANKSNICLLQHDRNMGQGRGFRSGFEKASGDILITLDADLSYEPRYIGKLIDKMEKSKADIVIASAFLPGSNIIDVPFYRKVLTKSANKFLSLTSSLDLSAITCAVRAYKRDAISVLSLKSDGMDINLEIILKAQMLGLHVAEIPAILKWKPISKSKSKQRRRSKMNILRTIYRYFFFGYLFSPNFLFLIPLCFSLFIFLVYFFTLLRVLINKFQYFLVTQSDPLLLAISHALRWAFANYAHAFYFLISSLVISFFLFIAWFLTKQNKFYFEQNYSLLSSLLSVQRKLLEKENE